MFIAHLPAGYLASHALTKGRADRGKLIALGMFVSLLPDFDLLWFYLVDNRQTPHHAYLFHWPMFWCAMGAAAMLIARATGQIWAYRYIFVAVVCLLLHMALDSFAAEIFWLKPFSDMHANVVEVPARYEGWVWNFLLHWTFLAEVLICGAAAFTHWRASR